MNRPAPDPTSRHYPLNGGGRQERAVLSVLLECQGRVVGRRELARRAGLTDLSERRCDSLLVVLRRQIGPGSIITVRRRGWMLAADAVDDAQAWLELGPMADEEDDTLAYGERAS